MADLLAEQGHETQLVDASDAAAAIDPRDFDAVIIAASVHAGRYQSAVIHVVRDHLATINARPNVFLSVSLAAAGGDEEDVEGLKKCVAAFTDETGWTPQYIHQVAGAFPLHRIRFHETMGDEIHRPSQGWPHGHESRLRAH